jgi:hypothetical protein
MKRSWIDSVLLALGLGPGTRIDLLNLAQGPAVNLWPHRLVAGVSALFIAVLATGMTRQWNDMRNHRPSPGSTLANLQAGLNGVKLQIAGQQSKFDPKDAAALGGQVREANVLITQRAFKPTELLADLEAVKPFGGRLLGLRRGSVDRGGVMLLDFHLHAPSRKSYEDFAARIGRSHRFGNLELRGENYQNGEFEADVALQWTPVGAAEATELPPGAEKAVQRGAAERAPVVSAARPSAAPVTRPAPAPAGVPQFPPRPGNVPRPPKLKGAR